MKFKQKQMAIAIAGLAGALSMQGVHAADAPVLEEVIVTAQKIEENIQKIPVAVTALSAETLRTTGISSFSDLQQIKVPGLSMQPFAGRSELMAVNIRGISTADPGQGTTDSGVAIVVDDVYNARGFGVGISAAELERVEVLRGPQGTLFGRNAVGGAVRMITKGPSGEFGGNVKLGVTSYRGTSAEAHLNTQEVNGLSFKVDLKDMKHDGFTKNPSSPSALAVRHDWGEVEGQGAKFSARLKATDTLKFDYSYEDNTYNSVTTLNQHDVPPAVCQGAPCAASSRLFAIPVSSVGQYTKTDWMGSYNGPSKTEYKNHRFGIEWQLMDNLTLKSITSHTEVELQLHEGILSDAYPQTSFGGATIAAIGRRTPAAFGTSGIAAAGLTGANQIFGISGTLPWANVESKTTSQEFQLIGNTDTLKWIAGLYWFQEKSRDQRTTAFTKAATAFAGGVPTNWVATNPFFLTANASTVDDAGKSDTQSKVESYALFMQGTWTPASSPKWHLTGGLRYSHDQRQFHRSVELGLPVNLDRPDFKLSRVDPLVSVAYDLNDATNVYARYSSAYRAGGASVRLTPWNGAFGQFVTYKEEVDKTIEGGIKTELMDRRLRLNAATFLTLSKGPILSVQLDPAFSSITGTINLPGEQKIKGIELESTFAATERLTLGANLAWMKYEYSNDVANYIRTKDPGAKYSPAPFPKYSVGLMADYVMPVSVGEVALHIDWNKTSKGEYNSSRIAPGSYDHKIWNDVANARATWRGIQAGSTKLAVSAFVKNLMDTHTPIFIGTSGPWVNSDPRMVGLEVSADF